MSSPGTASTGSSANSHCYGRSPEDSINVDSLINNLLQTVTCDDNGSLGDRAHNSSSSFGNHQCHNCVDSYCELCSPQRQTNFQNISIIDQLMRRDSSPLDMLNSSIINSSTPSPPIGVAYYCDIHRDAHKFYCQTCNKLLCDDCGKHHHRGHVTVHLMEAIEGAGIQANQVLKEAKLGITALKEDLDAVQTVAETLENKARQATADVMAYMRRLVAAIETRENELLARIEKARLMKCAALEARSDYLKKSLCRLSMTIDRLIEAMDSSATDSNPLDILLFKDMASAESTNLGTFVLAKPSIGLDSLFIQL
ncbi:hypothetical protein PV326_000646 [Microctonus aethiopoides]|nr:hypothetical protein PV326_000646 [Microctonus aethiopoides]